MVTIEKTHRNSVQYIHAQLVSKILDFLKTYDAIEFKTPFKVYVEEDTFDSETIMVPLTVTNMYDTGCVRTEDGEVLIASLSPYELAYILDVIEAGEYIYEEDDFMDPAGGRGLDSHI